MADKPDLLILVERTPAELARFAERYTVHHAVTKEERETAIATLADRIRAIVISGMGPLGDSDYARLPHLEIVSTLGVGTEGVDSEAAQRRDIVVTNAPGTNEVAVADHAMALLLSLVRAVPAADSAVKQGDFEGQRKPRPLLTDKRLGILGLGAIGARIAQRAQGFDMTVGYHNRQRRADVAYDYHPTPIALAEWADFIVLCLPGGLATRHIVGADFLAVLGAQGFLVNVGRGSLVDTDALTAALTASTIAGAALDVWEEEPVIPDALRDAPNLILTPHMAFFSPETRKASIDLILVNLDRHFAGQPVLTPVD